VKSIQAMADAVAGEVRAGVPGGILSLAASHRPTSDINAV